MKLQPTLKGMVQGIIAKRTDCGRDYYTLQCQDCGKTEEPEYLVLMTFKFIRCSYDKKPQRRCRPCTAIHIASCDYEMHKKER